MLCRLAYVACFGLVGVVADQFPPSAFRQRFSLVVDDLVFYACRGSPLYQQLGTNELVPVYTKSRLHA